MPYAVRQKVEEKIKNMHQAGITEKEKSTSAYGAPVVLVMKKRQQH